MITMPFRSWPQTPSSSRAASTASTLILAALAACDGSGSGAADADGPAIVLQASDVHVLGTSESIATIQDLEALPDGTVWVQNSVEPFFLAFGPAGDVLRTHGRGGGGPEEFGAPSGFVVGGIDGAAWVFDGQRHALIEVSGPESGRSEIALPPEAIPQGSVLGGMNLLTSMVRPAPLGDELILPRRSSQQESDIFSYWLSTWTADLVSLDRESGAVRSVVALGEAVGDPRPHFEPQSGGLPPFPLWYRLWAVCSDEEIRVFDRLRNEVRGFAPDGTELDAIALPPPRHPEVTPEEFARVTFDVAVVERAGAVRPGLSQMSAADSAQVIQQSVARIDGTPQQLANLLPRYVDLRCADDGALWLHPLDPEIGGLRGGPLWLRISAEGDVQEVRLPDRFDPYRFTDERIWGVQRDELDVAAVAWIAMPGAE